MAKNADNGGAEKPENAPQSVLVMQALGEHAALLQLVQGEGEAEIDFAVRAISDLRNMLGLRDQQLADQHEELKAANRRLASQRGATTKAKAKIVELEEAGRPRKLGPLSAVFDDGAEAFTVHDLLTAIDGAGELVLAFSDGENELVGIRPRQVRADAFRFTRGRVQFTDEPLEVTGPGQAGSALSLAGVALLVDGEQVAWSPMAQPIALGAGQTVNLAGSVIFE